jgi:hypothetical protein
MKIYLSRTSRDATGPGSVARCPGGEQDEGDDGCGQGHAGPGERGAGHGIGEGPAGGGLQGVTLGAAEQVARP